MLSNELKERYLRQIALPEVGLEGQERLAQSSALIVGVGGLGSPIATLLCSSGFGRIGIVDFDVVSLGNLPRQTLYTTDDIGLPKVECAMRRLTAMNPNVVIESYNMRLDSDSALELFPKYDMIIDGCDNPQTRYIIDHATSQLHKPYIFGAISGFMGQVSIFNYGGAAAYSTLFPLEDAAEVTCPPAVMSTTPAIIGAIEANEALKIAIGGFQDNTLAGKLLTFDSRSYSLNIFSI
ncbi:MAG: HesA/MoeB/ThiF family protein [Rikenellaceae bacterium]